MYETNQFRKGLKVEIDGEPYVMIECEFVKPGKGNAFTRTRLKHMVTGAVLARTYKTGERLEKANLIESAMQFLYEQGGEYHFMNMESYEQVGIPSDTLADAAPWLYDGLQVTVLMHDGKAISIDLPNFVELQITQCDPAVKGDTKNNATKPATLSTGAEVDVPLFIEQGEWLKIDTRVGQYVERVKKK